MAYGPQLKWLLLAGSLLYITCILTFCMKLDRVIKGRLEKSLDINQFEQDGLDNKDPSSELHENEYNEEYANDGYVLHNDREGNLNDRDPNQQGNVNKKKGTNETKNENKEEESNEENGKEAFKHDRSIEIDSNKGIKEGVHDEQINEINSNEDIREVSKKIQNKKNLDKEESSKMNSSEEIKEESKEKNNNEENDREESNGEHRNKDVNEDNVNEMNTNEEINKEDSNEINNNDETNEKKYKEADTVMNLKPLDGEDRDEDTNNEKSNDKVSKEAIGENEHDNNANINDNEKANTKGMDKHQSHHESISKGKGNSTIENVEDKQKISQVNDDQGITKEKNQNPQDVPAPQPDVKEEDTTVDKYLRLAQKLDFIDPDGPGEGIKAVDTNKDELKETEKQAFDKGWKDHAFNLYASDRISLHRKHPPIQPECERETYRPNEELPNASIVIIFHNEAWSVLLRTLHSVIERSPTQLLKEIVLVDDCSTLEHLHKPLEVYAEKLPATIKILRSAKREGLIQARLQGAEVATGDALIFLDSHVEAFEGWMEPLLDRIASNWTNVATPVIDAIKDENFQFIILKKETISVGGFSWTMSFNWMPTAPEEQERRRREGFSKPIPSPTMAGGLFAISRKYFYHLGSYDPGFQIWGGENTEISFRIWMCGGTLELVPCSHVAHIFRKRTPYTWGDAGINALYKNMNRVAEIWLDDYKSIFYDITKMNIDYGNVSDRIDLKQRLHCKDFSWYLKNIMPPFYVPKDKLSGYGEVKNAENPKMCLDGPAQHQPIVAYDCHGLYGNQGWYLSDDGSIQHADLCMAVEDEGKVLLQLCDATKGNQKWEYTDNLIKNPQTNKCMELNGQTVTVMSCNLSSTKQQWLWKKR